MKPVHSLFATAAVCGVLAVSALAFASEQPANPASWTDALATCVPGSSFDDCQKKLAAAGVPFEPPRGSTGHREINVVLRDPWEILEITTESEAGGRITKVRLQAKMRPGKARRDLYQWLDKRLSTGIGRNGTGTVGCGASDGGPTWYSAKEWTYPPEPEVQFAIDQFPTIRGANGRTMEDVIINTKSENQFLCFRLPQKKDKSYADAAPLAASVADFFRDSPPSVRPQVSPRQK